LRDKHSERERERDNFVGFDALGKWWGLNEWEERWRGWNTEAKAGRKRWRRRRRRRKS
jgi:hypothetical protein